MILHDIMVFRCEILARNNNGRLRFRFTSKTCIDHIERSVVEAHAKQLIEDDKVDAIVILGLDNPVAIWGKGAEFKWVDMNSVDLASYNPDWEPPETLSHNNDKKTGLECQALTKKGKPCKNNWTDTRDGHAACVTHMVTEEVHWQQQEG